MILKCVFQSFFSPRAFALVSCSGHKHIQWLKSFPKSPPASKFSVLLSSQRCLGRVHIRSTARDVFLIYCDDRLLNKANRSLVKEGAGAFLCSRFAPKYFIFLIRRFHCTFLSEF